MMTRVSERLLESMKDGLSVFSKRVRGLTALYRLTALRGTVALILGFASCRAQHDREIATTTTSGYQCNMGT